MRSRGPDRGKVWRRLAIAAAIVVVLALQVDDWGRDFIGYRASIDEASPQGGPRPIVSTRPVEQLIDAALWGAKRMGGWEFVGTAADGDATLVLFLYHGRLPPVDDDIVVRIESHGARNVLTVSATSRTHVGDLGRNPRNLRRLWVEIGQILEGAAPFPAPAWPAT